MNMCVCVCVCVRATASLRRRLTVVVYEKENYKCNDRVTVFSSIYGSIFSANRKFKEGIIINLSHDQFVGFPNITVVFVFVAAVGGVFKLWFL